MGIVFSDRLASNSSDLMIPVSRWYCQIETSSLMIPVSYRYCSFRMLLVWTGMLLLWRQSQLNKSWTLDAPPPSNNNKLWQKGDTARIASHNKRNLLFISNEYYIILILFLCAQSKVADWCAGGQSLLIGFECVSYAHRLSVRVRHSYHILQSYASGLDGEGKRWCDKAEKKQFRKCSCFDGLNNKKAFLSHRVTPCSGSVQKVGFKIQPWWESCFQTDWLPTQAI